MWKRGAVARVRCREYDSAGSARLAYPVACASSAREGDRCAEHEQVQ